MSKRIIVIPDVEGELTWLKAIRKEKKFDYAIFLGDYLTTAVPFKDQYENLKQILKYKENNPDTTALLIGDRDIQYFRPEFKNEADYDRINAETYKQLFQENSKAFNTAITISNIVFAHGIMTSDWIYRYKDSISETFKLKGGYDTAKAYSNAFRHIYSIEKYKAGLMEKSYLNGNEDRWACNGPFSTTSTERPAIRYVNFVVSSERIPDYKFRALGQALEGTHSCIIYANVEDPKYLVVEIEETARRLTVYSNTAKKATPYELRRVVTINRHIHEEEQPTY